MSARGNGEPRSISFVMLPSLSLVDLFVNPLGTGHIGASPITGAVPAPCRELCQFPGPRITAILRPPGLASLAASVDAAVVEGRLLPASFRGRVTRGVSLKTKVLLGGGRFQTLIARDGTFEFLDVPVGTYILEVQSPHLVYSRVRVVVTHSEVVALRVSIGDHFSNVLRVLSMPLTLRPRPRPIHYIPPEGQKVVGFFGNPMILMASFSVMMLLIMPRIMSNLDADALDALRSSYDFSSLPALSPQHMGLMVPPQQTSSSSSNSNSSQKQSHQAYSIEDSHSHDSFLNQPSATSYYSEKNKVDFAVLSDNSTVGISHGLYQSYHTTFGDHWAQQQPAGAGSAVPVQNKKQK
ncbi:MAG: hypothetical protein JOS17DRAFT_816006 [Linnemannia elongata]|nr:MAG: hypothetical protein JOS17DRAFT_816006 [Linnemannia elongata]